MESTLSEQHQQIVKNIFRKTEWNQLCRNNTNKLLNIFFPKDGMESTFSEQHQQIVKNIFPEDGME
jgi:hypothetical protein